MGPGDHHCHEGQSRICTEKVRDRHDRVIVQEKLDGSCVAVANINGEIVALMRAGYRCSAAPYEGIQRFGAWVREHEARFASFLQPGERLCGEWLAQAVGTKYKLPHEPFVVFDLMRGPERIPFNELCNRLGTNGTFYNEGKFVMPRLLSYGPPVSVAAALKHIETSGHGALEPVEGVVWRVERRGAFDFIAKFVRPDKIDGKYLVGKPESGGLTEHVWNEWPS
jgi:hypothetical protein